MREVDASTLRKLAALPTPSLNSSDDLVKGVMEWFEQGTYDDEQHLIKYFPHTAGDLRNGKVDPEQVAEEIVSILKTLDVQFDRPDVSANQQEPAVQPSLLSDLQRINEFTVDTTLLLLPRNWRPRWREEDETLSMELTTNLHALFSRHFTDDQPAIRTNPPEDFDQYLLQSLYSCVQELLASWAPRLDNHFFKGERGAFLAKSPMGKATLEEYTRMMQTLREDKEWSPEQHHRRMLEALHLDLTAAAKYIQQGVHEVMETCWECSKFGTPNRDLQRCGKCEVALYCGRDCQRKAWKCGHKKKCKELLQRHTKMEEQFKIVDDAHFTGFLNGVRLQCELDYHVAQSTVFVDSVLHDDELSMRTYYENLSRVIKGEWWLVAKTDSLDEFMARATLRVDPDDDTLMTSQYNLGFLLCTDYFRCAKMKFGISEPSDVTNCFHEALCGIMASFGVDATLPADWFLLFYERREYGPYNTDPKLVRRHKKGYAYERLKEKFHK